MHTLGLCGNNNRYQFNCTQGHFPPCSSPYNFVSSKFYGLTLIFTKGTQCTQRVWGCPYIAFACLKKKSY